MYIRLRKTNGETLDQVEKTGYEIVAIVDMVPKWYKTTWEPVSYAVQAEQLGTGHAVLQAESLLKEKKEQQLSSVETLHVVKRNSFISFNGRAWTYRRGNNPYSERSQLDTDRVIRDARRFCSQKRRTKKTQLLERTTVKEINTNLLTASH